MNALGFTGWDDLGAKNGTWRIERETAQKPQVAAFFPDQNGGIYERLLSALPVALHCMDASGRLISANQQWCEVFGYALHEVLGRSFSEFLPPESRTKLVTAIYPKYLTTSACRAEEILMIRKDGSLATVLLSMTAYRGDKGRLDRSVCMLEDVTEKKIAAMASSRSDQRFRAAFAASVHAMAVISPTGQIEFANEAFKTFIERRDVETATYGFDELLLKEDRGQFLNGLRQLLSGESSQFCADLRFANSDGKIAHGCQMKPASSSWSCALSALKARLCMVPLRWLLSKMIRAAQNNWSSRLSM
jgi:PAS domain S-box-containing protein